MAVEDDYHDWLAHGIEKGWVSDGVCSMHDILPMTTEEATIFEDGGDPCIPALRIWGPEGKTKDENDGN